MGSLQLILPKDVSNATEEAFLEKLNSKMTLAVDLMVTSVRAVEEAYGAEGVEVIHQALLRKAGEQGKKKAETLAEHSPRALCTTIENGCAGSHEWEKIVDEENTQAYRFTRCMWAEVFNDLDARDIGYWICEADAPMVRAFNHQIVFQRTKTLMMGDDYCDHQYYIKKR